MKTKEVFEKKYYLRKKKKDEDKRFTGFSYCS